MTKLSDLPFKTSNVDCGGTGSGDHRWKFDNNLTSFCENINLISISRPNL